MAVKIDDISLNTILGSGSSIKGDLKINGFVRIDGDIEGNLSTDGNVIIGENARIKGNVNAKSAIIGGIILGDVFVKENIKLLSSSVVIGDILSRKIQIEEAALFQGHCISIKNQDEYDRISQTYLQSKSIIQKVYHL